MKVHLAFGKTGLDVELPEGYDYQLLEARSARPVEDAGAALASALDRPIASAPLAELARGKKSAAISVCDITRPAPNRIVLPPVLERLERAGVHRNAVTVLIATGLHRPATDSEIREIVGEELAGQLRIVNHYARQLSDHRFLGYTSTGTPVYIDERFVAADLHLTLGFIEPHLMLGFSGGRKLIAPGLAAQETIKQLHSPKFMREAKAVEGSIEENPLHRELLEIASLARHDFMVDVALTRDRRIAGVFAGNPVEAHRQGVDFVRRVMLEQLAEPVDAVITTSAGYPLDLTFYQAVKGVTAASHIVKPGGAILLFAQCSEGAGAPEFSRMLRENPSSRRFLDSLPGAPVEVDQWQLEKLALVMEKLRVLFYVPGLGAEYHPTLWGPAYSTPRQALEALFAGLPPRARVAVIPEGPYVLAKVREHGPAPACE
ncbi:MAG: nickel-dependent lactate racemase [Bryobacteraceae bacterium]|nr:nickel-dependent lactate racemase [Bryobacteraceae bacterium]MDW8380094.1 nickel-dependent lactate racemase [Bryobacterales bacterium]